MSNRPHSIVTAIRTEVRYKLVLAGTLPPVVYVLYFAMKATPHRTSVVPAMWLDTLVYPVTWSIWLYLSLFLFTPWAPLFMRSRRELRRYALEIIAMTAVSCTIFWIAPTVPALWDDVVEPVGFIHTQLRSLDGPANSLPSLHVSLVAHSLLLLLASPVLSVLHRMFFVAWGLGIVWSTIATRQHVVLDVAAGLVVAVTTCMCRKIK